MLADREFDELVVKELEGTLERVRTGGAGGKLERYLQRYAHFLVKPHYIEIGEGDTSRRVYAITHLIFSTNVDAIEQASDEIAAAIENEL